MTLASLHAFLLGTHFLLNKQPFWKPSSLIYLLHNPAFTPIWHCSWPGGWRGGREYKEMITSTNEDYDKRLDKKKKDNSRTSVQVTDTPIKKRNGEIQARWLCISSPPWYSETNAGQAIKQSLLSYIYLVCAWRHYSTDWKRRKDSGILLDGILQYNLVRTRPQSNAA